MQLKAQCNYCLKQGNMLLVSATNTRDDGNKYQYQYKIKEEYDNIALALENIKYHEQERVICVDLKW